MNRFLEKDLYVKIFALFLAIILWLYVLNEQSPRIQRTFDIPLEYRSLAPGLAVVGPPDSIEVRVSGAKESVLALRNQQIKAHLDLQGIKEGQYFLPIKVDTPLTVEIVGISPERVKISLEQVVSKSVPVTPQIKGETVERETVAGATTAEKEVIVKGPRKKVEEVVLALAVVRLNEVGGNVQAQGKLVPVNRLGQMVKGVRVVPEFTRVSITTLPNKKVAVNPSLIGSPAPGYEVKKVMVNPAALRITGTTAQLEKVMGLVTENIDLTGATSDLQQDTRVVLPPGISLLDTRWVKVSVVIVPANLERTFTEVPVVLENLPSQWQAKLNPEQVDLVVQGQKNVLDKLHPGNIKVIVNGESVTQEGETHLAPQVPLPPGVRLLRVNPEKILITVKKKN